jgi:hypothetical protein
MDVLTALQAAWGQAGNPDYKAALEEAKTLYGYQITSLTQVNDLMKSEQETWDNQYILWQAQNAAYNMTISLLQTIQASFKAGSVEYTQLDQAINGLKADMEGINRAANSGWMADTAQQSGVVVSTYEEMKVAIDQVGGALQSLQGRQEAVKSAKALVDEAKRLSAAGKDAGNAWRDATSKAFGRPFTGTVDEAAESLKNLDGGLDQSVSNMEAKLNEWQAAILNAMSAEISNTLKVNPNAVDTSKYEAALAVINFWRRLLGLPEYSAGKGGGGGGGGGGSKYRKDIDAMEREVEMGRMTLEQELAKLDAIQEKYQSRSGKSTLKVEDQNDLEKRIYDLREQIRKEALQKDYDLIEHRKSMNDLSAADEIAALEEIKRARQLTAEESMEWDERYYAAKEELRQEQFDEDMAAYEHAKAMGELTVADEIARLQEILAANQLTQTEIWEIEEQLYALRKKQADDALAEQVEGVKSAYSMIVEALKARYAAEKEAEQAAIDEKIKALQDQTSAENEEQRLQEYQENLADLQKKLRLSKSARERRELQKQIDDAIAAEELRQKQ